MSDGTKRIIDQPLDTALSPGDLIIVDSEESGVGTRKFDLGTELTSVKQDFNDVINGITSTKLGKNILPPTLYDGYLTANGVVPYQDWRTTDYIDVGDLQAVIFSCRMISLNQRVANQTMHFLTTYNSNKERIEQVSSPSYTYTVGTGVKYIRFSQHIETLDQWMVEAGTTASSTYEPYTVTYSVDNVDLDAVLPNNMKTKLTPIVFGFTDNSVIGSDGSVVTTELNGYTVSDFIPVSEGEKYSMDATMKYNNAIVAFYNSSGTYLSMLKAAKGTSIGTNLYQFNGYVFEVPTNASKIRFAFYIERATNYHFSISKIEGQALTADFKKWDGLKWVCVGDSLTEINNRTAMHYFDFVANKTGIEVVNMGISGTGYASQQGSNEAFYQRVSSCPTDADVVTIFGSFNDLSTGLSVGSVDDTGTTTLAGCINNTITNLQTRIPLVNLGIVTPTPWSDRPPATSGTAYDYVEMIKAICKKRSIPCLDLWTCSNLRPWDSSFRAIAYTHDGGNGTHPSDEGHKLIAPRFEGFLDTLLLS